MPVTDKELPEVTEEAKALPGKTPRSRKLPKETKTEKSIPSEKPLTKELPPIVYPENVIKLGDEEIEIKPTKIKYQRNRTAAAYRLLDIYPVTDLLAMDKGILDPDRDGDAVIFDFLIAVFDDSKLVSKYYDNMTTEDIDKIVHIFKRLNKIDEKEEAAKNRVAKEQNH